MLCLCYTARYKFYCIILSLGLYRLCFDVTFSEACLALFSQRIFRIISCSGVLQFRYHYSVSDNLRDIHFCVLTLLTPRTLSLFVACNY